MHYVEPNPTRAGMVKAPGGYRWRSYRANALGQADNLVTRHLDYLALNTNPEVRRHAFRDLVCTEVDEPAWTLIRSATQQGVLVSDPRFTELIAQRLGQTVTSRPCGRPQNSRASTGKDCQP